VPAEWHASERLAVNLAVNQPFTAGRRRCDGMQTDYIADVLKRPNRTMASSWAGLHERNRQILWIAGPA
jgi:hypothetical protein